ncbi:MAG: deoxyribonuclease IV [Armatimonadetes bacterium]|nr:deoxyribonuclease IV [Armatimonadota bacterium]
MDRLLGAHMPTAGGVHKALYSGKAIGCTSVQIFTASPRQWKSNPLSDEAIEAWKAGQQETGIQSTVSHAAYLINLAATDEAVWRQSYDAYLQELHRCCQLGVRYAVVHMGSHLGQGEDVGIDRLIETFKLLLEEMPEGCLPALETMAGQGSALCYRFEHFARLFDAVPDKRLTVCADTCHLFAAGYDLRTQEAYDETMAEFDRLVGIERLSVWHVNDSKKPLGSRVDRHDHIGHGEIGEGGFRALMKDARFRNVPLLLETPEVDDFPKDLATLKRLEAE